MSADSHQSKARLTAGQFRNRLRNLILATWNIPPVFGLSFILFINVLNIEQMVGILTTPIEPGFIVFWIFFSIWYFRRYTQPVEEYLQKPNDETVVKAAERIRNFPLHYWGLFLTYLLLAPASVIIAAEVYTDFVARPIDWFRIHLVALIVSIIVGLPIFFMVLDLFGRVMEQAPLAKPHVTIKTKVFLIGALIPLLIDTILVQYFWTRTGFFTTETFTVWLVLELLAIGGSLIFVRSFRQSLAPLETLTREKQPTLQIDLEGLVSESTDEIGVLTKNYRRLLQDMKVQGEMLELNNMLLSKTGHDFSLDEIADTVIHLCESALEADKVFLILFDDESNELVGVAHSGVTYNNAGYYRLNMNETSMAVMVFKAGETIAINNVWEDTRVSPKMRERFNVKSAIATPLIAEARAIGVLMAASDTRIQNFTSRETIIIEGFAREVALAIHTHRLHASRMEAEMKGEEQQELIRLLMESTEEGIYGIDLDGVCTFVNPSCVRILGFESETELLGQRIHDLIHHTLPNGMPLPFEKCKIITSTLRDEKSHSTDEVHWRKDGTSFPVEYWSHPIYKNGEIVGTAVSFIDITQRLIAEETIRHMAFHDSLTGLVNRHEFENRLRHALDSVRQMHTKHALLYLDLDQFKVVNDTSGHEAGDELLRQLSKLLHEPVRDRDTIARLGGDEFGILLENCLSERALHIANQLVRMVREFRFVWREKTFSVGASIGICLIDDENLTPGEVLKTADMACYMSKELGRNRVHLFKPGDQDMIKRESEMSVVSQIHDALDNDRFVLYQQPIRALNSGAVSKHYQEIFVKMTNPAGEIIGAESFVQSAERYNLMPDIDRWVIVRTFEYAASHNGNSGEDLYFINLSGNSFNDQTFLAFIQEQLSRTMLDPLKVCLEVTETAAIANISQAQKFIHSIKSLGCRFALDDFGSGLSSFTYLKELDVDFLKIDGAFVRDVVHDRKDCSIVEAMNQIGRAMGIQTIAEYVENDEIMKKVIELGVDYAQGFGIEKPKPLE
jgi:diguanylate cyclase (GGDEF)-like protein/PAS domain S-box-containing protein